MQAHWLFPGPYVLIQQIPTLFILKTLCTVSLIRLENTSDKLKKERSFMTLFKAFS